MRKGGIMVNLVRPAPLGFCLLYSPNHIKENSVDEAPGSTRKMFEALHSKNSYSVLVIPKTASRAGGAIIYKATRSQWRKYSAPKR